ncbi:hypothetical protein BDR06DRAFT_136886 [Suillus hirtellus]|nr:hypothetical protein BDR06DRAFT_136886 [Suillus hirtellus]
MGTTICHDAGDDIDGRSYLGEWSFVSSGGHDARGVGPTRHYTWLLFHSHSSCNTIRLAGNWNAHVLIPAFYVIREVSFVVILLLSI